MRWLAVVLVLALAACTTRLSRDGRTETTFDLKYLAKSDVDRIADTNRAEVVDGLLLIADKLYKRNPNEWKKAGLASRERALEGLWSRRSPLELGDRREGTAAALAFSETYTGDRVAALIFGLLTMVDAAFEHKEEFYVLDSLDERKLFNCARNMDIAVWKLGHDRNAAGELYLFSNELDPENRNLSFERQFGRLMGLLDFMAVVVADRNGRGASRLAHAVATSVFLPVSVLK